MAGFTAIVCGTGKAVRGGPGTAAQGLTSWTSGNSDGEVTETMSSSVGGVPFDRLFL